MSSFPLLPKSETLHGFARSVLATHGMTPLVYNDLSGVIERDAEILGVTIATMSFPNQKFASTQQLQFTSTARPTTGPTSVTTTSFSGGSVPWRSSDGHREVRTDPALISSKTSTR